MHRPWPPILLLVVRCATHRHRQLMLLASNGSESIGRPLGAGAPSFSRLTRTWHGLRTASRESQP
ncbi:hypothetical protein B005_1623 [Nocardiopsis alba ATCC BAA-2165]|uniref:Uncharacterized protein n=1 Tax=Nocardiopsis alba (strain ATCC BAA-2165 / BE74) TaxID=1205910 RepID=J7LC02_NOCAA|nr:hypothetical protein B005_1623 [Nocardiopsis alba ATCC BAA-2165]